MPHGTVKHAKIGASTALYRIYFMPLLVADFRHVS